MKTLFVEHFTEILALIGGTLAASNLYNYQKRGFGQGKNAKRNH
jgi:hypothetical protein